MGSSLKKTTPTGGMAPVTLPGGFLPHKTVRSNVTNFTDTGLKPDAAYVYRVNAYRGGTTAMRLMDSDYSNEATAGAQGGTIGTTTSPTKQQLKIKPTIKPGVIQKK